jgi:dTDP-4-dehydrorhamnose 3,5-epimerase
MGILKKITPFDGLYQIKFNESKDFRGSFQRLFSLDCLYQCGWSGPIKQINFTKTLKLGTVRGLHFQHKPYTEKKIVYCIRGRVFDVVVDIRSGSPTFLKYHSLELSECSGDGLLIPDGFAHGFQALTDDVEMLYFHSENYEPKFEDGISPLDRSLNIKWPLDVINLSERDKKHSEIINNLSKFT